MELDSNGLPASPLAMSTAVEHRKKVVSPGQMRNVTIGRKTRSHGQSHDVLWEGQVG